MLARNTPRRQPLRTFLFALGNHSHTSSHTQRKGVSTRTTRTSEDLYQNILDIDDDYEDKYSDKYVYESKNDGIDNVNDGSSDGEAND